MPVIIPNDLPAVEILNSENIFTITEQTAVHQDIRPLKIGILNLMPTKEVTETQLLRLLGNSPLQIEITLVHMKSHTSKNTSDAHLERFYKDFQEIKSTKFDGFIITGAPVESHPFENVDYWEEMKEIMEWTKHNVYSTFHICWGAQAAVNYHYGVEKYDLEKKLFGVFPHEKTEVDSQILKGFDDIFYIPLSTHACVKLEDVQKAPELDVIAYSEEAGPSILVSKNHRMIFAFGHSEYDPDTLKREYDRDADKGLDIDIPRHYYHNDNPSKSPKVTWRAHGTLLFTNWLNYFVYQETPYDMQSIE